MTISPLWTACSRRVGMRQDLTPRKAVIAALSCLGLACFAQPIQADPVEGARFTLSQPDGGTVEVRICGD